MNGLLTGAGILLGTLTACGIYDVSRNRNRDAALVRRYFTGNGLWTWALSPLNTLVDLLCLPYVNRGVYRLEDLPPAYRAEVQDLIDAARGADVVGALEAAIRDNPRTMIFFQWYGAPVPGPIDLPVLRKRYRFIKTVGVSVFNRKQSTSKHFGPLRVTLRVLYNLNDMTDRSAYIEVGDVTHHWQDEKLFIFDDTLMHRSVNESEKVRYCLFVDILRPSHVAPLLSGLVRVFRFALQGVNHVFYRNWKVVKG